MILGLDMSQFDFFINTEPYTAWKVGTRYMRDSQNRLVFEIFSPK